MTEPLKLTTGPNGNRVLRYIHNRITWDIVFTRDRKKGGQKTLERECPYWEIVGKELREAAYETGR